MNQKLKISIITPNYNYAEFIRQTIESIIAQNYDNVEHIIVDDCSTDNSVELINTYKKKHPERIILLKNSTNKGQTPSINKALRHATGDIIGWINSDDYYCPDIFGEIAAAFEKNANTDIVYGPVNMVDLEGRFVYKLRPLKFNYKRAAFTGFTNALTSNGVFWRKKLTDQRGLMMDDLRCCMDATYFAKITYQAGMRKIKKPIANHRKHITLASTLDPDWETTMHNERKLAWHIAADNLFPNKKPSPLKLKLMKIFYSWQHRLLKNLMFYPVLQKIEKWQYHTKKNKNG